MSSLVGLTWSELARRLGTNPLTLRRWRQGARPNALHLLALLQFAASLNLLHLLPLPSVQTGEREEPETGSPSIAPTMPRPLDSS